MAKGIASYVPGLSSWRERHRQLQKAENAAHY